MQIWGNANPLEVLRLLPVWLRIYRILCFKAKQYCPTHRQNIANLFKLHFRIFILRSHKFGRQISELKECNMFQLWHTWIWDGWDGESKRARYRTLPVLHADTEAKAPAQRCTVWRCAAALSFTDVLSCKQNFLLILCTTHNVPWARQRTQRMIAKKYSSSAVKEP